MQYITPQGKIYTPFRSMLEQPHLLVAGATGSGKSVLLNGLISTALYKAPSAVRFILLDPKTTELHQWEKLPHVISYSFESSDMLRALRSAVDLMSTRLRKMHNNGERVWNGSQVYIVIDELADLILTEKNNVIPLLQRICQLGRAAGIHCIAATQCLLASVLPTQIRCNFSSIVCLRTATKQQSRFIIDRTGAELFPSPRAEGKALAFYRTGADCKTLEIYNVTPQEQKRLVAWWTGSQCKL